jgi:hypothetical protein
MVANYKHSMLLVDNTWVRGFNCVCLGMVVEATHEYIYRNLQEILKNSSTVHEKEKWNLP